MAVILVDREDTFDQWRVKANNVSLGLGDFWTLKSTDPTVVRAVNRNWTNIGVLTSLSTTLQSSLVDAINEVDAHTDTNTVSIGVLANLDTVNKSSLVNAVNEVVGDLGDLSTLTTDAKTDLVVAVNEVDAHTDTNTANIGDMVLAGPSAGGTLTEAVNNNWSFLEFMATIIGDAESFPYADDIEGNLNTINDWVQDHEDLLGADALNTTADYVTGAINEVYATASQIGDLSTLTTESQTTIVEAVNEIDALMDTVNASVGDLLLLETGDKSSLVGAINEVATNAVVMALTLG